MFELSHVSKFFPGGFSLLPVDLLIPVGKTTVLIGPSGCGKSTLLRLMSGLVEPDAGQVLFDRKPIADDLLNFRRRIGYVIQDGGLFPHLTGLQNVTLLARELRRPADEIHARVIELCKLTRLPIELLERFPGEMSGGQRQRVAIMRALMLNPDALLLDEPLGALDPMVRYELQADLSQIFKSLKKTVTMVTHDLTEAAFFADELVVMNEGKIVRKGPPTDVLKNPGDPFVEQFIRAQRPPAVEAA